jgi:hypothetical protein
MIAYLQAHPILSMMLAIITVLALVGLWYVVAHHLQAILTTLICGAGAASGAVVFWRGVNGDFIDLLVIGLFLMLIFPVIYMQAIRRERKAVQIAVTQVPGVVRPAGRV